MKNLYFLSFFLLASLLISCGDDEPTTQTVSWELNGQNFDEQRTINSGDNTTINLLLESTSLCASHGVRVVVTANGAEQLNEFIISFNTNLEITVPENIDIGISTSLEDSNPQILCITLGSVDCTLTY